MPLTNIIGSRAAMMVNVATIVGLPTSATPSIAVSTNPRLPRISQWRMIFSTITIASSTRMPIEKISANRLTRLMVKPISHEANRVSKIVVGMITNTTMPSLQPIASVIRTTIDSVASARWKSSSSAFSVAVSP